MIMRFAILLSGLALVGCSSQEAEAPDVVETAPAVDNASPVDTGEPSPDTETWDAPENAGADASKEGPIPTLDGNGLRMVLQTGATRVMAFGMERKLIENVVGRALGKGGTRSRNAECGAGPMEFSKVDGLTLNFQDGKFVGWTVEAPSSLSTMDGIAIGKTRGEIEDTRTLTMVDDSTLGQEFTTGGIGGFLDGEGGTVNMLFAGTQCFFR